VDNKALRRLVRSVIQSEIEEANATGNIDGGEGQYQTPHAFGSNKKREKTGHANGHKDPEVFDYKKVKKNSKHIAKLYEADIALSDDLQDLKAFIDDNAQMRKAIKLPIIKQLYGMVDKGKFTLSHALKPFLYFVEQGAIRYAKQNRGQWNIMFPKKERAKLALKYAQDFEKESVHG